MSQSNQHTRQNSSSFQEKRAFDPMRKSVQFSSRIPKMTHDPNKGRAPSQSARASTGQTGNIATEPVSLNLNNISSQQPQINSARGANHKTPIRHVSQIPSIASTTQFNYSYQSTQLSQQNSFSASKEVPTGRLSAEQKSQRLQGLMNSSFRKSQKVKSVDHSLLLDNSSRIKSAASSIPPVKVAELFRENQSLHSELTLVKLKIQSIQNNQARFLETLKGERRAQGQRIEELSIENTQMSQRIADLEALVHNLIATNPKLGTRIELPVSASSSNKVSRRGTPTRFKTTSKQFTGLGTVQDMSKSSLTQEFLGNKMLSVIREREAEQIKSALRRSIANSSSNVIETISEDQIGDTPRDQTKAMGGNYRTQRFEMSPQDYRKAGAYFRSAQMPTEVKKFGGAGNMSVQDSLDIQSEMNTSKQQQHLMQKLKKLNRSGIKPKQHLKRQSQNLADQTRNIQFKTQNNLTFRHQEEVPENLDVEDISVKKPCSGHFTESGVARMPQQKRGIARSLQSTLGERRYCICEGELSRISSKQIRQHRLSQGDDSLTLFDTTENDESILKRENYSTVCGKYCRNLPAKEQAKIISEVLKLENSSPLKMNVENRQDLEGLQPRAERGQEGEKKYILSALWWNKWRDFVNLGCADDLAEQRPRLTYEHTMAQQDGDMQPDLRNSIDTMRAKLSGVHGASQDYSRPSRINNSSLLDSKQLLKPGLLEHFDYVGISLEVWRYLVAWYSCDWIIVRFLRRDLHSSTQKKVRLYLEMYPEDPQPAQSARQKGHMRMATTGGANPRCEQSEERERLMKNLDRDAKLLAKKLRGSISSFANRTKEEDLSYYLSGSPAQEYMNHENSLFLMHDMPQIDDPIPTLGSEDLKDLRRK